MPELGAARLRVPAARALCPTPERAYRAMLELAARLESHTTAALLLSRDDVAPLVTERPANAILATAGQRSATRRHQARCAARAEIARFAVHGVCTPLQGSDGGSVHAWYTRSFPRLELLRFIRNLGRSDIRDSLLRLAGSRPRCKFAARGALGQPMCTKRVCRLTTVAITARATGGLVRHACVLRSA